MKRGKREMMQINADQNNVEETSTNKEKTHDTENTESKKSIEESILSDDEETTCSYCGTVLKEEPLVVHLKVCKKKKERDNSKPILTDDGKKVYVLLNGKYGPHSFPKVKREVKQESKRSRTRRMSRSYAAAITIEKEKELPPLRRSKRDRNKVTYVEEGVLPLVSHHIMSIGMLIETKKLTETKPSALEMLLNQSKLKQSVGEIGIIEEEDGVEESKETDEEVQVKKNIEVQKSGSDEIDMDVDEKIKKVSKVDRLLAKAKEEDDASAKLATMLQKSRAEYGFGKKRPNHATNYIKRILCPNPSKASGASEHVVVAEEAKRNQQKASDEDTRIDYSLGVYNPIALASLHQSKRLPIVPMSSSTAQRGQSTQQKPLQQHQQKQPTTLPSKMNMQTAATLYQQQTLYQQTVLAEHRRQQAARQQAMQQQQQQQQMQQRSTSQQSSSSSTTVVPQTTMTHTSAQASQDTGTSANTTAPASLTPAQQRQQQEQWRQMQLASQIFAAQNPQQRRQVAELASKLQAQVNASGAQQLAVAASGTRSQQSVYLNQQQQQQQQQQAAAIAAAAAQRGTPQQQAASSAYHQYYQQMFPQQYQQAWASQQAALQQQQWRQHLVQQQQQQQQQQQKQQQKTG